MRVSNNGRGDRACDADEDRVDLLAVAKGNRQSFSKLFSRFAPRLKIYLMRQGSTPAAAEELVQETMLAVWRKANQYDPTLGSGAAWIYVIARNLRIDRLRRERHPDDVGAGWQNEGERPQTPEELFLHDEQGRRLENAVDQLSPAQMEVIRRAMRGEGSLSKVAQDLRLPIATARSHMRRAIVRLREALRDGR